MKQLLLLEGWAFCLLALFTLLGGRSLDQAEQGYGGGLVGWGLVELVSKILPDPFLLVLFIALFVVFGLFGFGLTRRFSEWIDAWLATPDEPDLVDLAALTSDSTQSTAQGPASSRTQKSEKHRSLININPPSRPAGALHRDERLPPFNLLGSEQTTRVDESHIHDIAALLERTLAEFGIPAHVMGFRVGPTVTQYAVEPGFIEKTGPDGEITRQKIRISQISALSRDLALRLSAERLRIEAPVPGKSFVGVEVPNPRSTVVRLRPMLEFGRFSKTQFTFGDCIRAGCFRAASRSRSVSYAASINCRYNRIR